MLILSRSRNETSFDTELAETLATRFNVKVLSIPFLYDVRSFGPVVRRLQEQNDIELFLVPFPVRATKSLCAFLELSDPVCVDTRSQDIESILNAAEALLANRTDLNRNGLPSQGAPGVERLDEMSVRRWYPLIDKTECIGCLECVNFCLFGVYTIGQNEQPLVDQPDACRNGCPACSRICPGAAILFPMHETPDIAGDSPAEEVRSRQNANTADSERSRHTLKTDIAETKIPDKDELDSLVDEVDNISFE